MNKIKINSINIRGALCLSFLLVLLIMGLDYILFPLKTRYTVSKAALGPINASILPLLPFVPKSFIQMRKVYFPFHKKYS